MLEAEEIEATVMDMLMNTYISASFKVARIMSFKDEMDRQQDRLYTKIDYIEEASENSLSDVDTSMDDHESASEFQTQNLKIRLELIKAQISYN